MAVDRQGDGQGDGENDSTPTPLTDPFDGSHLTTH
jgi:hypothetical protein